MTKLTLKTVIMDEIAVDRAITRISHEIVEHNNGVKNLALVGIVTRGLPLAKKVQAKISQIEGVTLPLGKLDITLYRDDLSEISAKPKVNGTQIDFDVTGKDVVLLDDVIYTGRTVRAALDAIIALGRPRTIQLAVLIDRGHREFPIRADYAGKNVPTSRNEVIAVRFVESDGAQNVSIYSLDK